MAFHTGLAYNTTLRPAASDSNTSGSLSVDWMRMTPYASPGTFLSRIHDAGSPAANWGTLSYVADVPSGTTLGLEVRTGETLTPDGTWSSFVPAASGQDVAPSGRYLQYRLTATSTTGLVTPTLQSVTLQYTTTPETTAPTITGRTPAPGATGVAIGTDVTVTFSEPMKPATITASTVTLRAQGAVTDVPATVSLAGTTATLDPSASLDPLKVYTVTVAASVADTAGNPLGTAATWTFKTAGEVWDTTRADFAAGTGTGTVPIPVGDGALSLGGPATYDFEVGPSLPAGLTATPWTAGGTATVAGGLVSIDASIVRSDASYGPGSSVDFVATLGTSPGQHIGFGTDLDTQPWAIFSSNGTTLQARTKTASGTLDSDLGGSYLGVPHWYRIEWDTSAIRFFVDGVLVQTHAATIGSGMQVVASEFNAGGAVLPVYHLVVQSPVGSGVFVSRVLDPKITADWGTLSADAVTPAGTAVSFETRTGGTSSPDGSWSSWTLVVGGAIASPTARFIQYRATLTTSDVAIKPQVNSVRLFYTVGGPVLPVIGAAGPQGSWPGMSGAGGYALGAWNGASDQVSLPGAGSGVVAGEGFADAVEVDHDRGAGDAEPGAVEPAGGGLVRRQPAAVAGDVGRRVHR